MTAFIYVTSLILGWTRKIALIIYNNTNTVLYILSVTSQPQWLLKLTFLVVWSVHRNMKYISHVTWRWLWIILILIVILIELDTHFCAVVSAACILWSCSILWWGCVINLADVYQTRDVILTWRMTMTIRHVNNNINMVNEKRVTCLCVFCSGTVWFAAHTIMSLFLYYSIIADRSSEA